ncbi:MAG: hypothetical protein KGL59_09340 [Acidobacteriota bacterium]|nr:hypothetical protein [Acidobacteriota bacterium]
MAQFTRRHADAVAKKLGCRLVERKKHCFAQMYHGEKMVLMFGIRRGSREEGHDHLPRELHLTSKQCPELHDCSLSTEQFLTVLKEKGLL